VVSTERGEDVKAKKNKEGFLRSASIIKIFFFCKITNIADSIDFVTLLIHSKRQENKCVILLYYISLCNLLARDCKQIMLLFSRLSLIAFVYSPRLSRASIMCSLGK